MLKVRIKFRKDGISKFIGHLDMMRYFQKAMRRADIPIAFSGGYSPHMIMSFAQPLGIGLTSDGEYMDIEITEHISSKDAVAQLNKAMIEDVEVKSFLQISEEKKDSGMTIIAAADYAFTPNEAQQALFTEEKVAEFMARESIVVLKKTKRSEKEVDIKPMIHTLSMKDGKAFMCLAAGSEVNLKPELVISAFLDFQGVDPTTSPIQFRRLELYAKDKQDPSKLVTLDSLGKEII